MRTFTSAFEELPTREPLSHRDRGRAGGRTREAGQRMERLPSEERGRKRTAPLAERASLTRATRDLSRWERQEQQWLDFAQYYSSRLPARVASEPAATHRVLARTDTSAAEEPTT